MERSRGGCRVANAPARHPYLARGTRCSPSTSAITPAAPCRISTAETTMSCSTGDGSATVAAISAEREECIRVDDILAFACPNVADLCHPRPDRLAPGIDRRQRPVDAPAADRPDRCR